jgi:hypothetical protein
MSDEPILRPHERDAWSAVEPPPGFAESVVARVSAPKMKFPWRVAVALSAAVALVVLVWVVFDGEPARGSLRAADRTEISIADRAVAVAEQGSELAWESAEATVVDQRAGNVFYRVERGGPFSVRTRLGTVTVRGTCFRVEVDLLMERRMRSLSRVVSKQSIGAAGVGAALSAAVIVTVYEGEVVVANDRGETVLHAGERSGIAEGRAPSRAEDAAEPVPEVRVLDQAAIERLDLAELRREHESLQRAHEARRIELARLEAQLARTESAEPVSDERHFFPASGDDLRRWAENCELRLDEPPVLGIEPEALGDAREELGMTDDEGRVVEDAIRRVHERFRDELRALYVEATGDEAGAGSLSPRAMLDEIEDKATDDGNIYVRISRERAGLEPAPADTSHAPVNERAVRLYAGLGDELQRTIAQTLGPDRAYELRAHKQGWPWGHSRFRGECAR